MPTSKDFSVEDEAYLATIATEPKMTMDEVGADIEEYGHVPVTPETATQDPFTAKGSLAYALDEALSADTDLEKTIMTRDKNDNLDSHLTNPTDDFRDETKGEVEGTTSTPQGLIQPVESNKVGEGIEPTIQQDKAVQVKDSLAEALDAITMDGAEEIEAKPPIGKDPEPDLSKYNEEEASHIPLKAPKIPPSLGGAEDTPDANGLVYVTRTFVVDPTKYVSNNYRPSNMGKMQDAVAELKKASGAMKKQSVNPEKEAALSDLGTPEAKESAASPDEPTSQQEKAAAKEADKKESAQKQGKDSASIEEVVVEEKTSPIPNKKTDKEAKDEAPEKVVLDYATFLDGSSFICCDEINGIDYSVITMDARPRRAPTRQSCQTTFAQCRAENPLFCRFHGPKLLEADIRTALRAQLRSTLGNAGANGMVINVTKDRDSDNPMKFRVTVGCSPAQKPQVEHVLDEYFRNNPGITSHDNRGENSVGDLTQEFEMDILRADEPPEDSTFKARKANEKRNEAVAAGRQMEVVGETPENPTPLRRNVSARRTQRQPQVEPVETGNTEMQVLPSPQPQQAERQGEAQNTNPAEGILQATQGGEEGTPNQRNYGAHAGSQQHGEVAQPQQNPSEPEGPRPDNGIVHNEGGVKAPFSQSEIRALERELGRAIEDATNNPDDADKQAYFHALSHFMGSANSRYGRRNNALQGIRDGITKADLLAKAQRRLETTADADNMTRYNGSVRALETIAEMGGLHGLEIDGANISLAHPELDGQMPQREEEPQGAAEPNEGENGERNGDVQQPAEQPNSRQNAFTDEELRRAAEEVVNNGLDNDEDNSVAIIGDLVNNDDAPERQLQAQSVLENISREGNERLYDRLREIAGVNEQNGEATGGEQENNNQQPESAAQQPQPAQTGMPTEEDLRHAVDLIRNDTLNTTEELRSTPSDRLVTELRNRLNGITQIDSNQLAMLDSILPPGNAVRNAVHAAFDRQMQANEEARLARASEEEQRRSLSEASRGTDISTYPQGYRPNPTKSAEEIGQQVSDNLFFWETDEGKSIMSSDDRMNGATGRTKMARILATLFQSDSETMTEDEALVHSLLPDVVRDSKIDSYGVRSGQYNPFVSNQHASMNCYKGAYGLLLRMRGFKVTARASFVPSANNEHSSDSRLRGGDNTETYKEFQRGMSKAYEKVFGRPEELTSKFKEMAEGNAEKGIAPYPDGTYVMTWNGHARGNFLYKGKWFVVDPYGYDIGSTERPGNTNAPYIRPITYTQMANNAYRGEAGTEDQNVFNVINNLFERRTQTGDSQWNYAENDNNRQIVYEFALAARALRLTGFSMTGRGRGAGGRPSRADILRCARYMRNKGDNHIYHGSVVVRPNERLVADGVGLCEKVDE